MEAGVIAANEKQKTLDAMDVGSQSRLELQVRVLKAGTAGNVILEHAAVNEEAAYVALTGASWALNVANNTHATITGFLRYIRWAGDSAITGAPVAQIDVVSKAS